MIPTLCDFCGKEISIYHYFTFKYKTKIVETKNNSDARVKNISYDSKIACEDCGELIFDF